MNITIYHKNFELSPNIREYIEEKFSVLEKYQMDILNFHVELNHHTHHQKGNIFTVDVHISLPGKQKLYIQENQGDLYTAIDLLQTRIARQLVKHKAITLSKIKRGSKIIKSLKFWKR